MCDSFQRVDRCDAGGLCGSGIALAPGRIPDAFAFVALAVVVAGFRVRASRVSEVRVAGLPVPSVLVIVLRSSDVLGVVAGAGHTMRSSGYSGFHMRS